jgi:hypothetical protein
MEDERTEEEFRKAILGKMKKVLNDNDTVLFFSDKGVFFKGNLIGQHKDLESLPPISKTEYYDFIIDLNLNEVKL